MKVDIFNVFKNQGLVTPDNEGIVSLAVSDGATAASGVVPNFKPRQTRLGARLEWRFR